jgi:hypothetical protein
MSVSPQMMQMLLAQKLQQNPQAQSYGGGAAGPQMQAKASPLTAGSDMAQKIMLMRALQQNPQGAPPTQAAPQQPGVGAGPPANPSGVNALTGAPMGVPPGVTTNFDQMGQPGVTTNFGS